MAIKKKCQGTYGCGIEKELSAYRMNPERRTLYTTCIACERSYKTSVRNKNKSVSTAAKQSYLLYRSASLVTTNLLTSGIYKLCLRCQIPKEVHFFNKLASSKDGLQEQCITCDNAIYQKRKERIKTTSLAKKCDTCHRLLLSDQFALNGLSPDGRKNRCLVCSITHPVKRHSPEYLTRLTKRLCTLYTIPYVEGILLKKCPDCELPEKISEFSEDLTTGDGKTARCRKHHVWYDNGTFHGFKMKANQLLNAAVKSGVIIKPDCCERCGDSDKRIEAHHIDYTKALAVSWLCSRCHSLWHRDHEFVVHFFHGAVPKDTVDSTMKKYFRYFHIESTKMLSIYVGVVAKVL